MNPSEISPHLLLKAQQLRKELQFFLRPGVDLSQKNCTKEKLEEMMKHFEVDRELIPKRGRRKEFFVDAYTKHLEPKLQPLIRKSSANVPAAESKKRAAFLQPTAASCTELRTAIITKIRAAMVPATFTKAALVRLWKHAFVGHVSDDPSEFVDRPHYFTMDDISSKSRDVLRHALQCECPEIFIPLSACTEPILRALYERFVLDNEELDNELCYGVHYYQIPDYDPPEGSSTSHHNGKAGVSAEVSAEDTAMKDRDTDSML